MKSHLLSCTNILHFIRNMHRKLCSGRYLGMLIIEACGFLENPVKAISKKSHFLTRSITSQNPLLPKVRPSWPILRSA